MRRVLAVCAASLLAGGANAAPRPFDWIVAIVGGEAITFSEVAERARLIAAARGASLGRMSEEETKSLMREALRILERDSLFVEEARRRGITVEPDELEQAADRLLERARNRFASEAEFERALAQEYLTPEALRENFKRQAEGDLYRDKLFDAVIRPKILVSEEEIQAEYEKRKVEVYVRHVYFPSSERERAEQVLAELRSGTPFDRIFAMYPGEDLGWVRAGGLDGAFEEAAFSLDAGEVSGLVESGFGLHIIEVRGRRAVAPPPLTQELRDELRAAVWNRKFAKDVDDLLEELEGKVYIREYLSRLPKPDDTLP